MNFYLHFLLLCFIGSGSAVAQSKLPACPFFGEKHNCFGSYTFPSGSKYVGEFKANKLEGQGTYSFANGDKYVGEFKANMRNGKGTLTLVNGNKYIGEYKNGKRSGNGTLFAAGGHIISEGVWDDDKFVKQLTVSAPEQSTKSPVNIQQPALAIKPLTDTPPQSSRKHFQMFVCYGDFNHDSAARSVADLLLEIMHSGSGMGYGQVIASTSRSFASSTVGGGCVDHGFETSRLPANSAKVRTLEKDDSYYSLYKNQGASGVVYTGLIEYK